MRLAAIIRAGALAAALAMALSAGGLRAESEETTLWREAVSAYQERRYGAAETALIRLRGRRTDTLGASDPQTLAASRLLGLAYAAQSKSTVAEATLRAAAALARGTQKLRIENNLAYVINGQGRHREAVALYGQVLEGRRAQLGPDDAQSLATANNLASALRLAGDVAASDALLAETCPHSARVLGAEAQVTLSCRSNHAAVLELRGDLARAEAIYRDVAEIRARVLGADHPRRLRSLGNQAVALAGMGRLHRAAELHREVFALQEAALGPDHPEALTAAFNLGSALNRLGRRDAALALQNAALDTALRRLGPDHPKTLAFRNNLAVTLQDLERFEEAGAQTRAVAEARLRILGPTHPSTLASQVGRANALRDLGRYGEAEAQLRDSLAVLEQGLGADHPATLLAVSGLAEVLSRSGQAAAALPHFARVEAHWAERLGADHPNTLLIRMRYAKALQRAGRAAEALRPARLALAGHGRRITVAALRRQGGQGWQHEAAEAGGQTALIAWEAARTGDPDALRAEAFRAAQIGGGGESEAAIVRSAARIAAGEQGLSALVAQWEGALREGAAIDRQFTAPDLPQDNRRQLRDRQAALAARITALEAEMAEAFPRFFDLIRPDPLTLGDVQSALSADAALVLVTPGVARQPGKAGQPGEDGQPGLVWAVTRDGAAWARVALGPDALVDRIGTLHAMLDGAQSDRLRAPLTGDGGARIAGRLGVGYDRALAHSLYEALFGAPEIAALLANKSEWILVPQGPLLSLPFAALVTTPPEGADDDPEALRATQWLGTTKALSVLPSVATLTVLAGRSERQAARPFLGLGDPSFTGPPATDRSIAALPRAAALFEDATGRTQAVRALPKLPGTRREVTEMALALGAEAEDMFLGQRANETELARLSDTGRLRGTEVILFATHGLLAGALDGLAEPALALSPPAGGPRPIDPPGTATDAAPQGGRLDDGLLTMSEAARLSIDADWVILSACDTAAGATPDSSGLTGLARAFFYAGSEALLVSHWPVDDSVATRLTTHAVTQARGAETSRARALQASMAAVLADKSRAAYAHPAFWAPFQLVGLP